MKAWREGGSWAALCVDREAVEEEEGGKKPAGWAGTCWETCLAMAVKGPARD